MRVMLPCLIFFQYQMYPNVYGESSTDATQTSWNRLDKTEPYNLYGFYGVFSL